MEGTTAIFFYSSMHLPTMQIYPAERYIRNVYPDNAFGRSVQVFYCGALTPPLSIAQSSPVPVNTLTTPF